MGILDAFLGGATAFTGTMANVYADQIKTNSQMRLEEQRNRWAMDREIALEALRGEREARSQDVKYGHDLGLTGIRESGEDRRLGVRVESEEKTRQEAREARAAERVQDREFREEENEKTRALQRELTGIREGSKQSAQGQRLPEDVKLRWTDVSKEIYGQESELRKARAEALKPENVGNEAKSGAYINEIKKGINDLKNERVQIEIEHGLRDPEKVISRAATKFQSLDDLNGFLKQAGDAHGVSWAQALGDASERLGVPQRVAQKAQPTQGSSLRLQEREAGVPTQVAEPEGILNRAASNGSLTGPPSDADWADRSKGLQESWRNYMRESNGVSLADVTPAEISTMGLAEVQSLLERSGQLNKSQLQAARARLRQVGR